MTGRSEVESELDLPESRPWVDALRRGWDDKEGGARAWLGDALRSRSGAFFLVIWLPAFLLVQYVMFGLAMGAHGAGFDDCDSTVMSGEVTLGSTAEMGVFGVVAVMGTAALAIWRLRGRALMVALAGVAVSVLPWAVVLWGPQDCG